MECLVFIEMRALLLYVICFLPIFPLSTLLAPCFYFSHSLRHPQHDDNCFFAYYAYVQPAVMWFEENWVEKWFLSWKTARGGKVKNFLRYYKQMRYDETVIIVQLWIEFSQLDWNFNLVKKIWERGGENKMEQNGKWNKKDVARNWTFYKL